MNWIHALWGKIVNDQAAFKAQCHAIRYDFCLVLRREHRNRNFMGVVEIDFLVGVVRIVTMQKSLSYDKIGPVSFHSC